VSAVDAGWIRPDWPVHGRVRALVTTRSGGISTGPWGVPPSGIGGMNVGLLAGDSLDAVRENRARLRAVLPSEPRWLKQVHGPSVVRADDVTEPPEADAAFTTTPGVVVAVLVADCMPVLLADVEGRCVGVAHAGWRGVASGVIQSTVRAMQSAMGRSATELVAWLGPAIGRSHFEVGPEVLTAMVGALPAAAEAFQPYGAKYRADLFALGRQALQQVGVTRVYGGAECTYSAPERFYSFRRDRVTGRHAALVWIDPA
jgi:YfiH family protein